MEILDSVNVDKLNTGTVITIGKFDGLHTGHDYLINTIKRIAAEKGLKTMVCTFSNPPLNLIDNIENDVLLTFGEKKTRVAKLGIDYLTVWNFDERFMHLQPEEFVKYLVSAYNMRAFVCGRDFRFGYRRAGDIELLVELSKKYSFEVEILDKLQEDNSVVSSTRIKELIMSGNIKEANRLLGYEYFIGGEVVNGIKLGRKMGFPTANIIPENGKVLPPFGVYESRIELEDKVYKGITNIGTKPTVTNDLKIIIETYLKGFSGNLYGEYINVELVDFLRAEKKFSSLDELINQIKTDISQI